MWDQAQLLWQVWYGSALYELGRYFIGVGGIFLLVYVFFKKPLAGRKIRKKHPTTRQMWREIKASVISTGVYAFVGFLTYFGVRAGIMDVQSGYGDMGWTYFFGSIVLMIVAQDAYFYWGHRLMHLPGAMKYIHGEHHKSINPTPWTSYRFDVWEAATHALFVPLFLFFVPMSAMGIFIFMTHMVIRNAVGHSGYELYPRWWARHPIMGQINLVTHHDMHHANGQCNFGLWFTWWDRWMGTEHPDYLTKASGEIMSSHNAKQQAIPTIEVV